jgi:hypothetical protein
VPNRRACRAGPTKDFDDLMGDPAKDYKAVIFNPVPGPPMGRHTRLAFRYWLDGTDSIRVQIYSLTNGYHRRLVLSGLPQRRWESATVDMTHLRRPDGSGGPLSADERIDDIQFYIEPSAELVIDDIVLYEAAHDGSRENTARQQPSPFPARIMFTGWFDTGQQGKEWPGQFEIVPHEPPRTWKAARSVRDEASGKQVLGVDLRGRRPLGERITLCFRYHAPSGQTLDVHLQDSQTGHTWTADRKVAEGGDWLEAKVELSLQTPREPEVGGEHTWFADQLVFSSTSGAAFLVDDVLLYEPKN